MRSAVRVGLIAMMCWLSAQASAQPASQPATPATQPADPPLRHAPSGLAFPARAGDWRRHESTEYPDPALGMSVRYRLGKWMRADVYIYNGGHREVPEGIDSDLIKDHLEQIIGDVFAIKEQGGYDDVKELKRETLRLGEGEGAPRVRRVTLELVTDGQKLLSEAYLTGFRNHFLKIRVTYPTELREAAEKAMPELLAELGRAMKAAGAADPAAR
jgi:hypothetical protein